MISSIKIWELFNPRVPLRFDLFFFGTTVSDILKRCISIKYVKIEIDTTHCSQIWQDAKLGLTVSEQHSGDGERSIYGVATAWTEIYINITNNETIQQALCMRQMRPYDSSNSGSNLVCVYFFLCLQPLRNRTSPAKCFVLWASGLQWFYCALSTLLCIDCFIYSLLISSIQFTTQGHMQ